MTHGICFNDLPLVLKGSDVAAGFGLSPLFSSGRYSSEGQRPYNYVHLVWAKLAVVNFTSSEECEMCLQEGVFPAKGAQNNFYQSIG